MSDPTNSRSVAFQRSPPDRENTVENIEALRGLGVVFARVGGLVLVLEVL